MPEIHNITVQLEYVCKPDKRRQLDKPGEGILKHIYHALCINCLFGSVHYME